MSVRFPIIATTGSSGSGTTSVKNTFERIFRREGIKAAFIEGDAFHRYDRQAMKLKVAEEVARGNHHFSHFGPQANLLDDLEAVLDEFSRTGRGRTRQYVHNFPEEQLFGAPQGTFTAWEDFEEGCDLLFYEGLHGAYRSDTHDIARFADLKIGVVPVINLEWIQKIHRDKETRGYSTEAVTDVILRRMHDYVHYICPQFTETDINFQRVPTVDTSNPFVARWIPTADESMVVIRFRSPKGIDFPYLLSMIPSSFMSRANSIVVPGGKMELAMQLILTPQILRLMDRKNRAV